MKARAGLILVLVALATLPADAARRTPKRVPPTQAPNAGWCPVYRGSLDSQPQQSSNGGRLVFTAAASTHRVTVVSCDRGVDGAFPAAGSDLFLTDVAVAKLPTWLAGLDQNYPSYQHAFCDVDAIEPGRFNRSATAPDMPFRDLFFPAPSAAWLLQGAEAATGSGCTAGFPANQGCLVLARASRAGATDGRCTSATLTVGGLTAGDDYVVDFDWYSSAPPAGGFQAMDVYLMDAPASLSIADVSVNEGNAGTTSAVFTVRLDPTLGQALTVPWSTTNASAAAPGDYQTASGTLTFAASASTATLSVPVVGDTAVEGNETFLVNLGTPSLATVERLDSQAVGTIVDDEGGVQPTLSVADMQVAEGNSGTTNAMFTVTLAPSSASPVTVQYQTEDVEAQGTARTVTASGAITISPTTGTVVPYPANLTVGAAGPGAVTKVTARLLGFTHTFTRDVDVLLVGPGGQGVVLMSDTGGGNAASGLSLVFDDAGAPLGTGPLASGIFQPTNLEDGEPVGDSWPAPAPAGPYATALSAFAGLDPTGTWQLFVFDDFAAFDGGSLDGFSLTFEYAGGDYQAVSGTLTFTPGSTTRTVAVPVIGDVQVETNERFLLQLGNPAGAVLGTPSAAHGTILDDDGAPPAASVGDAALVEGNSGTSVVNVPVSLSGVSAQPVTVDYRTLDVTARSARPSRRAGSAIIPDTAAVHPVPATPYPLRVTLPPGVLAGSITKVSVSVRLGHTWPGDLDIALVGPSGQAVTLLSDVGGGTDVDDATLVFDDAGATPGAPLVSGTYRPTNLEDNQPAGDFWPSPAPALPYAAALAAFTGHSPIGDWSLFVVDDFDADGGELRGFSVTVQTASGSFVADSTLRIPSLGQAAPYPISIDVPPTTGTISKLTASFRVTHSFVDDVDMLLVGPGGQKVVLMSDVAGHPVGVDLTFDDAGVPFAGGAIAPGTHPPTNLEDGQPPGDSWPAPAPAPPYGSALAVFNGSSPSGRWDVYVVDDTAGDSGVIQDLTLHFQLTGAVGLDYQAASGTLSFAPGATTANIPVSVFGDSSQEASETFQVELSAPTNAALGDASGQVTILDDDLTARLSIAATTVAERDGPGVVASLPVWLDSPAATVVSVPWSTQSATATAPADYAAGSGTLTFAPGEMVKTLQVAIAGDLVPEAGETFALSLGTPSGATLEVAVGGVAIRDDDPASVDFGPDGRSDVAVYRGGAWLPFDYASGTALPGVWTGQPLPSCIPAPADYDGDGRAEFSQLCGGSWHFYGPTGALIKTISAGSSSDVPVPADYDGDGKDEVVVYRLGAWLFFNYQTGLFVNGVFTGHPPHFTGGTPTPYPADFDGDGRADLSVYSGGPWHFFNPDGSYRKGIWVGSIANDIPVAGDYDGDAVDDLVIWRAGAWLRFDYSSGAYLPTASVFTGAPPHFTGGVPLPAPLDVDGDGDLDFAVYSGGPWHFYGPSGSYLKGIWCGAVPGDRPLSRRPQP